MKTYFVDSNVFFYAKIRDKKYGDACAEILRRITGNQVTGATSTLAILETSNALRKYGRQDEIEDEITAIYSLPITVHELLNMDIRLASEPLRLCPRSRHEKNRNNGDTIGRRATLRPYPRDQENRSPRPNIQRGPWKTDALRLGKDSLPRRRGGHLGAQRPNLKRTVGSSA